MDLSHIVLHGILELITLNLIVGTVVKRGIIITIGDERLNPYLPIRSRCSGLIATLLEII